MQKGADPLQPGEVLEGRYRIGPRIGEGAYAVVHEARAPDGRFVAVKALARNAEEIDPAAVQRFRREMKLAAELRHPNIVEVFDWGQTGDGRLYLVMERLVGHSLLDVMYQEPFPEASVRHVIAQVLEALRYAHGRGFVHRDIKPSNVFLCPPPVSAPAAEPPRAAPLPWAVSPPPASHRDAGLYGVQLEPEEEPPPLGPRDTLRDAGPFPEAMTRSGSAKDTGDRVGLLGRYADLGLAPDATTQVKILDFGLSKGLWGKRRTFNSDLTSAGMMVGTPGYLAPEQLEDVKRTTPQMDLYAVGLLGYEMLVAEPAFDGVGVAAMFQQLTQEPKPPSRAVLRMRLYPIIEKLMARDTRQRYQSAAHALRDLERAG